MNKIKLFFTNLYIRLFINSRYFFKLWFWSKVHYRFPSLHKYRWIWVADCGCCGFEGVVCIQCHNRIIIGHVGMGGTQYNRPDLESGDYVEYGY